MNELNYIQNLLHYSYLFGNTWASRVFWWPKFGWTLPLWFKIINPGLITSKYIVKSLFAVFWVHVQKFFLPLLHWSAFVHLLTKWGIHLAFIFLSFKCFFKIPWTLAYDKFVIWANCLTVNQTSFLSILWIFRFFLSTVVVAGLPVQVASLFVLRFYGPVNPMGSCRVWSVYLTTCLLGRLNPLSG